MNLFFRVLKRRSDGFHEIASLFQAVNLFDRIIFEQSDRDVLTCSYSLLPCDESNLVMRALRLFQNYFPCPFPVKIHLEKRIPIEAGLGGGSSNAATTLWALNELASRPATLEQLIEMGALLGSDVAFFFSSGSAYCTGRGEIFERFVLPKPLNGWIVKPPFGLSTPRVYQETNIDELPLRDPRDALALYPCFYNDLESAAYRLEPRLLLFRKKLEQMGFDSVTMTGSGTAFFCIGGTPLLPADFSSIPIHSVERTNMETWYG